MRVLLVLLCSLSVCFSQMVIDSYRLAISGAGPFTDDFNRANAGTLGSNWTQSGALSLSINSNQAQVTSSGASVEQGLALWNTVLNNNQYSQVTFKSGSAGSYVILAVRWTNPGASETGYLVVCDYGAGTWTLYRLLSGAASNLASGSVTFAANDVFRLEASGTTITFKRNGATLASPTNSDVSSGKAGLVLNSAGAGDTTIVDDWSGGNL